jgi:hypothetical protein
LAQSSPIGQTERAAAPVAEKEERAPVSESPFEAFVSGQSGKMDPEQFRTALALGIASADTKQAAVQAVATVD